MNRVVERLDDERRSLGDDFSDSCTSSARGTATSTTSARGGTRPTRARGCGRSRSRSRGARSLSASEAVEAARALLGEETSISQAELSALLSAAIKLYTSLSPDPYGDEALAGLTITPTEACTVGLGAAALPVADPLRVLRVVLHRREVDAPCPSIRASPRSSRCTTASPGAGDARPRPPAGRRARAGRLLRRRRRLAPRPDARRGRRCSATWRTRSCASTPSTTRGDGPHAVRAHAGRPRVHVPGHARARPAPGAHARGPGADRRAARRRALPPRDGRDEHRRAGRVPDLAAVAGHVADARGRVAGRLRLQQAGWSRSSAAASSA